MSAFDELWDLILQVISAQVRIREILRELEERVE